MAAVPYVRVCSDARRSSRRATVKRCPGAQDWPIEAKLAGVTLGMTEAGARTLLAQLQAALPPVTPRRRSTTVLYDCGAAGRLTLSEAAAIAGTHVAQIRSRLDDGVVGDALVARKSRTGAQ